MDAEDCCGQGNVVLTDGKYEVLTLLRSHRDDDRGMALMPRHPYPIHTIRCREALDADQLSAALAAADDKGTLKGLPPYLQRVAMMGPVQPLAYFIPMPEGISSAGPTCMLLMLVLVN